MNRNFGQKALEKALDKGGYHIGCWMGIHDYNKKGICKKCDFIKPNGKNTTGSKI